MVISSSCEAFVTLEALLLNGLLVSHQGAVMVISLCRFDHASKQGKEIILVNSGKKSIWN